MTAEAATESKSRTSPTIELIDPCDLIPSEVNEQVYRPVDPDDPAIRALREIIQDHALAALGVDE